MRVAARYTCVSVSNHNYRQGGTLFVIFDYIERANIHNCNHLSQSYCYHTAIDGLSWGMVMCVHGVCSSIHTCVGVSSTSEREERNDKFFVIYRANIYTTGITYPNDMATILRSKGELGYNVDPPH